MKKKLSFLLALCLLFPFAGKAQTLDTPAEISAARDTVSAFIRSLQYTSGVATGAFKKSNAPAYYEGATGMYFVEPYFTHIACMALLEEDEAENLAAVEAWMDWYISKVGENPDGCPNAPLMMNYFYDANGGSETTNSAEMGDAFSCTIDAEDSDPALFFMLAYRYYKKNPSSNAAWFTKVGVRSKLESFVNFLYDELYDTTTGLTDAKRTWTMKYTMDNSEVHAGMRAFIGIMNDIYGVMSSSELTRATTMKNTIEAAIFDLNMYPSGTPTSYNDFKLFGSTNCCDGYLDGQRMYDFTPILWPVLFGIDTDFDSAAATYVRNLINEAMRGWNQPEWYMTAAAGGFWDTSVGYFFSMSTDPASQAAGKTQAINAVNESFKLDSMGAESFISDAGWLLLNLQVIAGNNVKLYNY